MQQKKKTSTYTINKLNVKVKSSFTNERNLKELLFNIASSVIKEK